MADAVQQPMADVAAIYDLRGRGLFRFGEPWAGSLSERAVHTDFYTAGCRDVCNRAAADLFRTAYARANIRLC
ncbi:hypothetical protein D3C86_2208670 [compost metagenome]